MSWRRIGLAEAAVAALASAGAVALVTVAIAIAKPYVPVLSLGVLYVFAVLPVAVAWGLVFAVPVSVASMLAFNWFFLPPPHTVALDRDALQREALEAEALRRSDAAKTAVLRAVSHDLRSPLTAIDAAASGLDSPSLRLRDEDRQALLATIREETARLRRLVENLLDLSRLEAGVAQPHPELWPPEDLVAQALDEVGPRGAGVAVDLADSVPPVRVDAVQIQRVLANLIENALKFSPPGGEGVRVEVEAVDGEVHLHVVDRGPGIPAADREHVFEPFRRLDGGSRGAGLGLAIARGFVQANGGRVWAENGDRGAHLVVALPAAE